MVELAAKGATNDKRVGLVRVSRCPYFYMCVCLVSVASLAVVLRPDHVYVWSAQLYIEMRLVSYPQQRVRKI